MIEYEEKTAARLQEEYSLADATIRVWKFRNRIPARYFGETKYELAPMATRGQVLRIVAYCNLPFINRKGFSPLPTHRLRDMLRDNKHARFTKIEAKIVLDKLKTLIAAAKLVLAEPTCAHLRAFLAEPILRPLVFMNNSKLYNRVRQGLKELSPEEWQTIFPLFAPLLEG